MLNMTRRKSSLAGFRASNQCRVSEELAEHAVGLKRSVCAATSPK
jgi:hypothetical protein